MLVNVVVMKLVSMCVMFVNRCIGSFGDCRNEVSVGFMLVGVGMFVNVMMLSDSC